MRRLTAGNIVQNEARWSLIKQNWWKFSFLHEWNFLLHSRLTAADAYRIEECQSHARAITESERVFRFCFSVEILNSREHWQNVEDNLLQISLEKRFSSFESWKLLLCQLHGRPISWTSIANETVNLNSREAESFDDFNFNPFSSTRKCHKKLYNYFESTSIIFICRKLKFIFLT